MRRIHVRDGRTAIHIRIPLAHNADVWKTLGRTKRLYESWRHSRNPEGQPDSESPILGDWYLTHEDGTRQPILVFSGLGPRAQHTSGVTEGITEAVTQMLESVWPSLLIDSVAVTGGSMVCGTEECAIDS